ncbi:rho GTPase-activating protein SYDE1 [Heteronotia binoei]|uniref:rho GTPase-activating protein SYDE1 n=1 Tax=Heteronotia binoei TaxID=13085 RepID=UPI0029311F0C|nr:rho GTPase-activating protein SYDE1 [Heteronotia binoei]
MAQPLLRKTLSRLRRKESRGCPKARGGDCPLESPGTLECFAAQGKPLPSDEGGGKAAAVTVSRKQKWAKVESGVREDSCSGESCFSQPPRGAVAQDETPSPEISGEGATRPEVATEMPAGSVEVCSSTVSLRCSSRGAYLQSLERSSREWVLSSGKAPGVEEPAASTSPELTEAVAFCSSEGEIWYNPIPEDEDLQPPSPGRTKGSSAGTKEAKDKKPKEEAAAGGSQPSSPSQSKPAVPSEEWVGRQHQTRGKVPVTSPGPEERATGQSPSAHKKDHPPHKTKPSGPVRTLSMKMKKLPELRRRLSLRSFRPRGQEAEGNLSPKESRNVISRYHLDSSVASRHHPARDAAMSKGDCFSDGDSPELPAKTDARFLGLEGTSFQPYRFAEHPGCLQPLSGLVSIHLLGVQDFRPPRAEAKEVFCVLQVDSVNKARTALLPCRSASLSLNHSFQLELEDSRLLKIVIFSCDPAAQRNRVCCCGTILLPHIFQGSRSQQLAMQLQPRGLLYIKLTLLDQRGPASGVDKPQVFGVELSQLVERERAALKVPLLIQKCVDQIEKRGLKIVGLYRLCGSAVVKKELRDAFEKDSDAVVLSEEFYPDINAITGILKDYLRELPTPLITSHLYQVVLEAMSNRAAGQDVEETTGFLDCLPEAEKATLRLLLDHLSLVAAFYDFNRMNAQNLAVCFGPVLLSQGPGRTGGHSLDSQHPSVSSTVDFKHHIEVLHYLLQAWPGEQCAAQQRMAEAGELIPPTEHHQWPLSLDLPEQQPTVVVRSHSRGPESPPTNRYAGDWSVCGQHLSLAPPRESGIHKKAAGSESDNENDKEAALRDGLMCHGQGIFLDSFALVEDPEDAFSPRISLKDFDALLMDLEQELCKQINVCL